MLVVTLEHWKNWNTGTLEQLEHWNNRDNKKVVVDSVVKIYGGCGLCVGKKYGNYDSIGKKYGSYGLFREEVWWLRTL